MATVASACIGSGQPPARESFLAANLEIAGVMLRFYSGPTIDAVDHSRPGSQRKQKGPQLTGWTDVTPRPIELE
jgi:hypothetical protein